MKNFILKIEDLAGYTQEQVLAGNNGKLLFTVIKHYKTKVEVGYKLIYYVDDGKNNMIKRTKFFSTLEYAVYYFNNIDEIKEND